jgi:hypothetical protein
MAKAKVTALDPTVNYVEVKLEGKTWKLAYDFHALALAEQLTGQPLVEALYLQGITMRQLQGLFLAAALKAQPKTTPEEVVALMSNLRNMMAIQKAVADAWVASMPPADDDDPNGLRRATEEIHPASE